MCTICLRWDRISAATSADTAPKPTVAIRACLWREVVPRQRGKGLTRSRV